MKMFEKINFIENPYEARIVALPIELTFSTGKEKRNERRKLERKRKNKH